ncbi:MAG: alpha/beta hydrolase [Rhodospirillaceae bacterium]|nr:alpha/beta hydrolase [Rhodospirillaceae bacterium]MCY4238527.1 alpha/beta hydrolase [Rhodospirillaceae bacterium]
MENASCAQTAALCRASRLYYLLSTQRMLVLLIMIGVANIISACSIPGPKAAKNEIAGLQEVTWQVAADSTMVKGGEGFRMSARIAGNSQGRRIIFIHGTPGQASGWADYLLTVPEDLEYIAIDRPGFGKSGPVGAIVSLKRQAAAIEHLLVRRGGRWPIIVGHSLGGPIAARAAADFPSKVGGLIILAGSLDPALEKIELIQKIVRIFALDRLLPRRMRNANLELLGLQPELKSLQVKLGGIKCPLTIIHGTKDTLVPYSNVSFMQRKMKAAQPQKVLRLDGKMHFLPWLEKPAIDQAIGEMARWTTKSC